MMRKKGKEEGQHTTTTTTTTTTTNFPHSDSDPPPPPAPAPTLICYEGERLLHLLQSIQSKIDTGGLLLKFWLKQNFSIGVNEVTRVLERMPPYPPPNPSIPTTIQLQAILLASDSCPRSLIRHLPKLASSRKVPLIFVKDKKGGSLKLGELVKLKTSIAIGVKAKRNAINQLMEGIIGGNQVYNGVEI